MIFKLMSRISCGGSNPYIHTTVVQEVYNRDHSAEVEGLAAAATKHLELLITKG